MDLRSNWYYFQSRFCIVVVSCFRDFLCALFDLMYCFRQTVAKKRSKSDGEDEQKATEGNTSIHSAALRADVAAVRSAPLDTLEATNDAG